MEFENKETVVQRTRVERTDSDKVIRRNSMERKMSVRNSIKLPQDFLNGLKGLDTSLTRMSLAGSVRGLSDSQTSFQGSLGSNPDTNPSAHGPTFTPEEIEQMSKQALEFSDSDSEVSMDMEEPIQNI